MSESFIPREISPDAAAQGFNNQGNGDLIGYVAIPDRHELTCRYRISTGGNPDKNPHESCTCRIGLWRRNKQTPKAKAIQKRKPRKRKAK